MSSPQKSTDTTWHEADLSDSQRWTSLKSQGATLWFTGLSGSGKSTIAAALEKVLIQQGRHSYRLDGDNIRHGLNGDLGFTAEDRRENIRRISEVAQLFAHSGTLVITSFISPFSADRDRARINHDKAQLPFIEIHVGTPLEVYEERDPKGLYRKARAGEIKDFTGIDSPYESPHNAELVLDTTDASIQECVQSCIDLLESRNLLRWQQK